MKKKCSFVFYALVAAVLILSISACSMMKKKHPKPSMLELNRKIELMLPKIQQYYGEGGLEVFNMAGEGLKQNHFDSKCYLVSIEDLWTHALQEGSVLFNKPERRWGPTDYDETNDMLGQLTVGPWQITDKNIKNIYGLPYGLKKDASRKEVIAWCVKNPKIQAQMISDYIQLSYDTYGKRNPYGIQRYFWLEPFAKGEAGQSKEWWKSPVAIPPKGKTYKDLTPEQIKDTGFYGKQIICGHPHQTRGLLYWLAVTKDIEGIDGVLRQWRDAKKCTWNAKDEAAVMTDENGGFALSPEDLKFWPEEDASLKKVVVDRMNIISKEKSPIK